MSTRALCPSTKLLPSLCAVAACTGSHTIHSTRTPELRPATALHVISDVGLRGDGDAGDFRRAVRDGLSSCSLPATVEMLSLLENNQQVHLRSARAAGAAQLLTVLNDGASTSMEGTSLAGYTATLYDVAQERAVWRATINTDRFGAALANALMAQMARDGGLPPHCFPEQ